MYSKLSTPSSDISGGGFYKNSVSLYGVHILGSQNISEDAFYVAAEIVGNMISNNTAMQTALVDQNASIGILGAVTDFQFPKVVAAEEFLTDLPDYSNLSSVFPGTDWNNLRGVGGVPGRPMASVGEENLLNLPTDPHRGAESILVHEFSHSIMNLYANSTSLGTQITSAFSNAVGANLWSNTYAITNKDEYFAETVQSWFDDNPSTPVAGIHNDIDTRVELKNYDPTMYALLETIFREDSWTPGQFLGTSEANELSGTDNNDVFFALGGDDRISIKSGSDIVDGGDGFDTVTTALAYAGMTSSGGNGDYTITSGNGGASLQLVSVERVIFSDGTLAFDLDGSAGQTYRLYQAAFDRMPDQAGLSHNVNLMDEGLSIFDMASAFIESLEFQNIYGADINDTQFLTLLYQNVLNRAPDQAGLDGWLGRLGSGTERKEVLFGFSESTENKATVAPAIDDGIWLT